MSSDIFCYCMNSPITNRDINGLCSESAICNCTNTSKQPWIESAIASLRPDFFNTMISMPRLLGTSLLYDGSIYSIKPYEWDGPVWLPLPTTLVKGTGRVTKYSRKQAGINFAAHDFETTGLMYIFANAMITTTVDVEIYQYGNMEPRASVHISLSRMHADTSDGVHHQKNLYAEYWVCSKAGNEYVLRDIDGKRYTYVDEEDWISAAFAAIKWEK